MAGQYPEVDLPAGTTIMGVVPGFANTRNGQKQVFDVQCSNGQQYRTFNSGAGAQAQAAVGNPNVTIRISINGQYQNFEGVYPVGQAPAIGMQAAPQAQFTPPAGQQQFTPAPAGTFVDAKLVEMRRVGGMQNATSVLGPLVGAGFYIRGTDDGDVLDIDALVADLITIAGASARYTVFGPSGEAAAPAEAAAPQAAALPPGVTAEQVAAWAAAQGADVVVGTGAVEPTPTGDGPADY